MYSLKAINFPISKALAISYNFWYAKFPKSFNSKYFQISIMISSLTHGLLSRSIYLNFPLFGNFLTSSLLLWAVIFFFFFLFHLPSRFQFRTSSCAPWLPVQRVHRWRQFTGEIQLLSHIQSCLWSQSPQLSYLNKWQPLWYVHKSVQNRNHFSMHLPWTSPTKDFLELDWKTNRQLLEQSPSTGSLWDTTP